MLVKIFILNFLLQILNGCNSTIDNSTIDDNSIDCDCSNNNSYQNKLLTDYSVYILSNADTELSKLYLAIINTQIYKNYTKDEYYNLFDAIKDIIILPKWKPDKVKENIIDEINWFENHIKDEINKHCYYNLWMNVDLRKSTPNNNWLLSGEKQYVYFMIKQIFHEMEVDQYPKNLSKDYVGGSFDPPNSCLGGIPPVPEEPPGKVDCNCVVPDVQNQIIANLYSHIISEIGDNTYYNLNIKKIQDITENKLTEHIQNIKNKVKDDQNLHCYKRMWVYNSDKIINLISTSKDAITEFFKVCKKFDEFDINYWNLGKPYIGGFFDPPNSCLGGIPPVPEEPQKPSK